MTRADMLRQLATLAEGGVPLHEGLERLAPHLPAPWPTRARAWASHLAAGEPLSAALAAVPPGLPSGDHAQLEAAGLSGKTADCLRSLATASEAAERRSARLQTALIYPLLLLHAAALIPAFLTWTQRGLPAAAGQVLVVLLPFYALGLLLLLAWRGRNLRPHPTWQDAVLDRLPLVGGGLRLAAGARLARVLAGLLDAGFRVEDALTRAAASCGDPRLRQAVTVQAGRIAQGAGIADILQAARFPDGAALGLVRSGELSGSLPEALLRAADENDFRAGQRLDRAAIAAPIGCYLLAVVLAVLQIARILAPLYQTFDQVLQ